jgi:hypothetical protein
MKWFLGTMMYVTRIISAGDFDKIYDHLLPTTPGVIDGDAEITCIKQMVLQLQSDVCHTHELVARVWLNGPQGQEFLKVHRCHGVALTARFVSGCAVFLCRVRHEG